ncbi:MAG: leucine-rich repeat domain-containing protein [Alphaproteobacteria bacterium]
MNMKKIKIMISLAVLSFVILFAGYAVADNDSSAALNDVFTDDSTGVTITYKITNESPHQVQAGDSNGNAVSLLATDVTIPFSVVHDSQTYEVVRIGDNAFLGCINLESVTIDADLATIGAHAFQKCSSLTSVSLPESLMSIEEKAFYNCGSLTDITIPKNVITMGDNVFYGCTSLPSINVDGLNTVYSSVDGVLFNETLTELICYPAGRTGTSYTVPGGVSTVSTSAFSNCVYLESLDINEVSSLGIPAFYGSDRLGSITVNDLNTTYSSVDGVLFNKALTELICYPAGRTGTSYTVPGTVTAIDNRAFNYSHVETVYIGENVTTMGNNIFEDCLDLESVVVDSSNSDYSSVDGVLFNKAVSELIWYPAGRTDTSYTVPGTVTAIGTKAFEYCTDLESVTIPDKVTSIGNSAFAGCTLSRMTVEISGSALTSGGMVETYFSSDVLDGWLLEGQASRTLIHLTLTGISASGLPPSSIYGYGESEICLTYADDPVNYVYIDDVTGWQQAYTVILNAGSGSGGSPSFIIAYGDDTVIGYSAPHLLGYTLSGWYTSSSGGISVMNASGILISDAVGYTDSSSDWINTAGNVTLYAHWTMVDPGPTVYDITYRAGYGYTIYSSSSAISSEGTVTFTVNPISGYGLVGVYSDNGIIKSLGGGRYSLSGVTDNVTVWASAFANNPSPSSSSIDNEEGVVMWIVVLVAAAAALTIMVAGVVYLKKE